LNLNKEEFSIKQNKSPWLERKIGNEFYAKTQKSLGAFGFFKHWLIPMASCQKKVLPTLKHPTLLIFCSDNGFLKSTYWAHKETPSSGQILQKLQEQDPLHKINQQSQLNISLIDVGVDYNFESDIAFWINHGKGLINAKIGEGCANFFKYPALTAAQARSAFTVGVKLAQRATFKKSNFLALSGLGQGQTFNALVLTAALLHKTPRALVDEPLQNYYPKIPLESLAKKALNEHPKTHDVFTLLCLYGNYHLAALMGAMLAAAEKQITICIDNLSATLALFMASKIAPETIGYCVFTAEPATKLEKTIFKNLKAQPILGQPMVASSGLRTAVALNLYKQQLMLCKDPL
jgi:nicotinate-nucleotide--dimethylbenzimidazole phosphoribosyltransferase